MQGARSIGLAKKKYFKTLLIRVSYTRKTKYVEARGSVIRFFRSGSSRIIRCSFGENGKNGKVPRKSLIALSFYISSSGQKTVTVLTKELTRLDSCFFTPVVQRMNS